ncbi:outer membrane calcium-binding protein [Sulfurospirillum diekertiae]|uniref:Outer membrane calcium-binding protein n=1 Tax=Sulfurospirillum diekertiae TaxID=1854492 RepID=A0A290HC61_9BACT|nr:DUF4214 domain-containing protein [Sulfurospirillum diekertiae]ATB69047.1 outer membrane calcium-binding protein [Sulfurospirillum diekertiae]
MSTLSFNQSFYSNGVDLSQSNSFGFGENSGWDETTLIGQNSTQVHVKLTKSNDASVYLDLTVDKADYSIIRYVPFGYDAAFGAFQSIFTYENASSAKFTIYDHDAYISANNYSGFIQDALSQADVIYGTNYNDKLYGYNGNDTIIGNYGNDILDGGNGNDTLNGGNGNDICVFHGAKNSYSILKTSSGFTINGIEGNDTLFDIEILQFNDVSISYSTTGIEAQAYRLYQAAFDRTPDKAGLGYWISAMNSGTSLQNVASSFLASTEFQSMYGTNASNSTFVTLLYNNILNRAPDDGGMNYWLNELSQNDISHRAGVLASFSESAENQANVISLIGNGIEYTMWVN